MYEKLYNLLRESNCDISQYNYYINNVIENSVETEKRFYFNNIEALGNLYNDEIKMSMVIVWNKLYKKEIFSDISFPEGKIHEDEYVMHKILYKANRIGYINEKLYFYRMNESSITNSCYNEKRLDIFNALKERIEFFNCINDDYLYKKAVEVYLSTIRGSYYLFKESGSNEKSTIKRRYLRDLKEYKYFFKLNLKNKIQYIFFSCSPKLYKWIIDKV